MTVGHGARAHRWIPLLGLLAYTATTAFASTTSPNEPVAAAERVIPRPDLSALSETARAKIETMQRALGEMSATGSGGAGELKEGFGLLGQLFHAFDLLDAAAICYGNAIELAPDDPRWAYYRALVLGSQGELDAAVAAYRRAIELAPEEQPARIRLGNALLELGRPEEAEAAFAAARRVDPDSAAALYGLGRAAAAAGRAQDAVDLFEGVLALQPEASIVHYPLAQAYRRLGNTERAEFHLEAQGERAVRFPDRLVDTLTLIAKSTALEVVGDLAARPDFDEEGFLGFVLSQFSRDTGAAEQLEKVIAHLESSGKGSAVQIGRIHYGIGGLLAGLGRGEEAIAQFEQAIAGDPELLDARIKLGNAFARGGRFDEAIAAYSQVLEARPEDTGVLFKRATALVNQEKLTEARADLERLTRIDPRGLEGRLLLGAVLEGQNQGQAAVDNLLAGLEAQKGNTGDDTAGDTTDETIRVALHTELAALYRRQQQPESAAREYLQALKIDQQHVPALSGLAGLMLQLGYAPQAAQTYERWVAQEPANVAARVGEVTSLIIAGAHVRAKERLEAGLAEVPASIDLKDLLARHLAACPDRTVRDGERALELALELFDAVPSLESMETVAMAYAEAGKSSDAVDWQKRLIAEAGDEATAADLGRWQSNLTLYERGEACCAAVR